MRTIRLSYAIYTIPFTLQAICKDIAAGTEVSLEDMIWANKLAKANTSARGMLSQARRLATDDDGSCLKYLDMAIQTENLKEDLMVQMTSLSGSNKTVQTIGDRD